MYVLFQPTLRRVLQYIINSKNVGYRLYYIDIYPFSFIYKHVQLFSFIFSVCSYLFPHSLYTDNTLLVIVLIFINDTLLVIVMLYCFLELKIWYCYSLIPEIMNICQLLLIVFFFLVLNKLISCSQCGPLFCLCKLVYNIYFDYIFVIVT